MAGPGRSTPRRTARFAPGRLSRSAVRAPHAPAAHRCALFTSADARDAITNGAPGAGGPFEFYDLGHGYCSYTFFEQCPHRMACARCDFYLPKQSSQAQLLEAKDGPQRMLVQVPLTDTGRAAIQGDQTAVDRLIAGLAETPTPAGGSPHAIAQHKQRAGNDERAGAP